MQLADYGNFSVIKPIGWLATENEGIYTFEPMANSSQTITFFASKVPKNMTADLQKLVELGLTSLHTKLPDLTVVSKAKPTTLGQFSAIEIQFTAIVDQDKMMFTQIFAKPKNRIYTLTYTCKADACNYFKEFYAIAKTMQIRS
jgi:hypothetical protein